MAYDALDWSLEAVQTRTRPGDWSPEPHSPSSSGSQPSSNSGPPQLRSPHSASQSIGSTPSTGKVPAYTWFKPDAVIGACISSSATPSTPWSSIAAAIASMASAVPAALQIALVMGTTSACEATFLPATL